MVNTCLVACMRVNVEIRPRGLMAFPAAKHASGCQAETCCVVARPWCSGVHGMCRETDITFRGWSRPSRACNRRGSRVLVPPELGYTQEGLLPQPPGFAARRQVRWGLQRLPRFGSPYSPQNVLYLQCDLFGYSLSCASLCSFDSL